MDYMYVACCAIQPETFTWIKQWSGFIEEHQPAVLLCIGNAPTEPATERELHRAAQEWTVDNDTPLEYIEVPHGDSKPVLAPEDDDYGGTCSSCVHCCRANRCVTLYWL